MYANILKYQFKQDKPMNIVRSVLDAMIESAEAVDSKLHSALEYLRELRDKLTTFSATEDDTADADELVNELKALASQQDRAV